MKAKQVDFLVKLSVFVIAVAFMVSSLYLVLTVWLPKYQETGHLIYSWPDAMANQAFINHFIQTGTFAMELAFNPGEVIHPRSVNVFQGNLVPMTFLGMLLVYGLAGKLITIIGTLFLTPFFAFLAIPFFYSILRRILDQTGALTATILLASFSGWVYYSSMVMLHTILFLSLLIIGFWFLTYTRTKAKSTDKLLIAKPGEAKEKPILSETIPSMAGKADKKSYYLYVLFGALFIGLALTVRTVEAPWVLLTCLILLIFLGGRRWWLKLLIFVVFLSVAFIPIVWQNNLLYGEPISVGYLKMNAGGNVFDRLPNEFKIDEPNVGLKTIKAIFLPFGWNGKTLIKNVYTYFWQFFWPYLLLTLFGLVWFLLSKQKTKRQWAYLTTALLSATWLIFYYGNWKFDDLDILKYNLIGSSYMRYWLPVYLLFLPGIGYLLSKIYNLKIPKFLSVFLIIICISSLGYYSYTWAYESPNDGLYQVKANLMQYYDRYDKTSQLLEDDAILIVDRTDKLFFPKYQVVVFLLNYDIFSELVKIIDKQPIYYLTVMPDKDIDYINRTKIGSLGLKFHSPQIVDQEYRLFRLSK